MCVQGLSVSGQKLLYMPGLPSQPYSVASTQNIKSELRTRAGPEHRHLHCYAGKLALQLGWCWGERVRLDGAIGLLCCRAVGLGCARRRPACLQPCAEVAAEGIRHQAPQLCHSASRNHHLQYPVLITWLPSRVCQPCRSTVSGTPLLLTCTC